jgi:hypothetical protein
MLLAGVQILGSPGLSRAPLGPIRFFGPDPLEPARADCTFRSRSARSARARSSGLHFSVQISISCPDQHILPARARSSGLKFSFQISISCSDPHILPARARSCPVQRYIRTYIYIYIYIYVFMPAGGPCAKYTNPQLAYVEGMPNKYIRFLSNRLSKI